MDYKRIFIEKKENLGMEEKNLYIDFKNYLNVSNIESVRVVNVYELVNAADEEVKKIVEDILFDRNSDHYYDETPSLQDDEMAFRVEYHRGQFNQREHSTKEIIHNFLGFTHIDIVHSKIIIVKNVSKDELNKIKSYYINPIESREIALNAFYYEVEKENNNDIEILHDFIHMDEEQIKELKDKNGIGMDMDDLLFCQGYFKEENRDPYIAELKIIDTYWSDHCRHTTFMTEITDINVEEGKYKEIFEDAIKEYIASRDYMYKEKERPICLMDLATINMKEIKKKGLLNDKEESDEVNAASIEIDVDINGEIEKYLLMFKNETHNHPTEMEPFGGAATCLGGGIRDPLSGRAYVYQAMRITGAGDPRQKLEDTLSGKLPQRKITQTAMEGYSSYGNQIGATSGYINEFYDDGFVAKRLELGALVAATPQANVLREDSEPSDLIILVGGRTGRDGLGAAVGSSKVQTEESLESSGAEVQKGNPILERKIVRLFRNPEATKLIKKCNDFGAGGVAVAVGELADGLYIDLNKVPVKYKGLNGGEIALSESQERMAIVIYEKDVDKFMKLVEEEDLEGTVIAKVTDKNRLQMVWNDKLIVDIDRKFLDTNGIRKKSNVNIVNPSEDIYLKRNPEHVENKDIKTAFKDNIKDLNIASQKGLVSRFDNTVGAGTVLNQMGGKYMLTPQEGMVAKIPVLDGETNTCSIFTCGYDPKLAKWSTFHGGYYAVIESIAKIVALGGDFRKIRLTFQEYFERLGNDPSKWGKPFNSLLGAFTVQKNLDIPSIGGKDSMSGSFEDLHVPPSLFSFAITHDNVKNIVSKEFKEIESNVVIVELKIDDNGLIDFEELKKNYSKIKELIDSGLVLSSSSVKFGGIARCIAEMAFGNKIGIKVNSEIEKDLFKPLYGSIILEIGKAHSLDILKGLNYSVIGKTIKEEQIEFEGFKLGLDELINSWEAPLMEVFPIDNVHEGILEDISYTGGNIIKNINKVSKPKVLIPIFTGNHGEYDMAQSFIDAGAEVEIFVFKTLNRFSIEESYIELSNKIKSSQILGLPNGQIYGDEPEGGGKVLNLIFNNPWVKESIEELLNKRDGLILGVGGGFIGLMKLGLITPSAFISFNKNARFTSTFADIKLVSNLSPWMNHMEVGSIYTAPVTTKEGNIILTSNEDTLIKSGQIATQFVSDIGLSDNKYLIESLTSPDGRVLGTISGIDRMGNNIYKNIDIKGTNSIFKSGVNYFK